MTLKNTIQAIVKENPDAIILINGDSLCGDFRSFKCPDTSKMIFIKDVVPFESAIPSILSQDLYIYYGQVFKIIYILEVCYLIVLYTQLKIMSFFH